MLSIAAVEGAAVQASLEPTLSCVLPLFLVSGFEPATPVIPATPLPSPCRTVHACALHFHSTLC